MPTRNASADWTGTLKAGKGEFRGETGLGAAYSFTSRFEPGTTGSNPEELLAAAHAACYSMAFALGLEKAGATPERVHTDAACTVEQKEGGFRITTMKLRTRVKASGVDEAKFQEIARATKDGCPVSGALRNNVDIQVEATLE
jgi:osmotically inducible protein OsmC